jgi:transcription antitermination factor NusG
MAAFNVFFIYNLGNLGMAQANHWYFGPTEDDEVPDGNASDTSSTVSEEDARDLGDDDEEEFHDGKAGQRVEIIGGKYRGLRGTYVRKTKKRVVVQFDDATEHCLARKNVRFLGPPSGPSDPPGHPTEGRDPSEPKEETMFFPEDLLNIVGGTYHGQTATVTKQTPKRVHVRIIGNDDERVRYLHFSSVAPAVVGDPLPAI